MIMTSSSHQMPPFSGDAVGNRTSSHLSASYTTAPFNRTTTATGISQTFDSNGNTATRTQSGASWTYTWDRENRLTQASSTGATVNYVYDALGRRVRRTEGLTDTKFTHDGQDVVLDDVASTLTKYQNGPGIDNKLSVKEGSTTSYFLADHLGSTDTLTDGSGAILTSQTYDSFGNSSNPAFASRYQFTGRERDQSTGLHYYRTRFFDGKLGKFISEDPIGFSGGDLNVYGYVRNMPLLFRDPSGLYPGADVMTYPPFWQAAAAAGGALAAGAGAAASSPALVAGGGLLAGGAIGYYPGQWTANHPSNPFVNGPWNPFGPPVSVRPLPPPTITGPYCVPMSRVVPFPKPKYGPLVPPPSPPVPPNRIERCESAFADCKASAGGDPRMTAMCTLSYSACIRTNLPVIFPNGIWVP